MPLERALFKIIGMYCASCKSIVEKQLKEENAIKRIDIDYMTDTVFVEFETSLITKEEIKRRLEKSGYKFVRVVALELLVVTLRELLGTRADKLCLFIHITLGQLLRYSP